MRATAARLQAHVENGTQQHLTFINLDPIRDTPPPAPNYDLPPGFNIANLGRRSSGIPSVSIQIDGSWDANTMYGGAAWVVYDHQQVIYSQGLFLYASSALQTEAVACLQATKCASSALLPNILINTDSALLVNYLKSVSTSDVTIDHTLNEIRREASGFNWFQIRKVSRDAVQQAHNIALSSRQNRFTFS